MSGLVDTNVVVRYLVGDVPALARKAASIIDGVDDLQMTDAVVAEIGYVLSSVYRIPRDLVVDHLVAFLRKENVRPLVLNKEIVIQALLFCRSSRRVSFADAMVWAAARSTNADVIYSFDERFPSDGIDIRSEP